MSLALPPKPRVINTKGKKLAIVASKYNEEYSDALVDHVIEELADYLSEMGIRNNYLHSDIQTLDRVEILRDGQRIRQFLR